MTWSPIRYDRRQLLAFLRTMDRHLERETELWLVGGSAACLAYEADVRTNDVDVFKLAAGSQEDVAKAAQRAREETGISIGIGPGAVAGLPDGSEERFKHLALGLRRLQIWAPDKYDLVISKALRGAEHDLQAIVSIHARHRLSRKTLVKRIEEEHIVGNERSQKLSVLVVIERLFGNEWARRIGKRWRIAWSE